MFIYEFMGTLMESVRGAGDNLARSVSRLSMSMRDENSENADYDPHEHRDVAHPTSYSDTMIHLLKGSLGAGILAMPDAMYRMGLIGSIIGMGFIGILATYCIQLLIAAQYRLCKRRRIPYMDYPTSVKLALSDGPCCLQPFATVFAKFVDCTLIIWQLGLCTVYAVFIASNCKMVADVHKFDAPIRVHLCYWLGPLILINLVKSLKAMTPVSTMSNILTIFGLILVFFYLVEDDVDWKKVPMGPQSAMDFPFFVGTSLFALEAVGVVLALEYNMDKPKQFVGCCGLFNKGMTIIVVLYVIVGVFGALKYGSNIKASITLNLPKQQKKAQAAQIIFSLAIYLSVPLQNFVAYNIILRKMKLYVVAPRRICVIDWFLRVILIVVPWLLAVAVPHLGPVISLFGAFCLSILAIIFPALIDLCLFHKKKSVICRLRVVHDVILTLMGILCLLSGCYTSILDIINNKD